MKTRQVITGTLLAAMAVGMVGTAQAAPPKMKYTTPVPASMYTPTRVKDLALGDLDLLTASRQENRPEGLGPVRFPARR